MVLVDVFVPSVDKTYNFSLNEQANIRTVLEEITEMIEQKEHVTLAGDTNALHLYEMKRGTPLPTDQSLYHCSVKSGSRLILV